MASLGLSWSLGYLLNPRTLHSLLSSYAVWIQPDMHRNPICPGRQWTLWLSRKDFKWSCLANVGDMASAQRQIGQREAAELGMELWPHVCCGCAVQYRKHIKFSPSWTAKWLTPELTRVATAAKKCRWTAELALSPAWGLFLHRCNHRPYLPLPMQYWASAMHYSSHYFITRQSRFFTEGIFSWLSSDSRVFWPLKLSLVLT